MGDVVSEDDADDEVERVTVVDADCVPVAVTETLRDDDTDDDVDSVADAVSDGDADVDVVTVDDSVRDSVTV